MRTVNRWSAWWASAPRIRTSAAPICISTTSESSAGSAQNFSLEVDYQGSTGHKLGLFVDQNQPAVIVNNPSSARKSAPNVQIYPYPTFGAIGTGKDIGNSNYNGMVATAKYQSRQGLLPAGLLHVQQVDRLQLGVLRFDAARLSGSRRIPITSILDRGPSSFDTRQRAVVVYNVDLPVGPGHRLLGWNNGIQPAGVRRLAGLRHHQRADRSAVHRVQQLRRFQRLQPERRPSGRRRERSAARPTTAIRTPRSTSAISVARRPADRRHLPQSSDRTRRNVGPKSILRSGPGELRLHGTEELPDLGRADPPDVPGGFLQSLQPHQLLEPDPHA